MKILLPPPDYNFFAGEHGLCFAGHHRGTQPEGWRFGTPTAPTESKPRPSRRSDRGSEGLLLGTPPSVRSPKVREDRKSRTLKPMPTESTEVARLRLSSCRKAKTRHQEHWSRHQEQARRWPVFAILWVGTRRQAKTGRCQHHGREWSVGPVVFVDQGEEDRLGLWAFLSCTAPTL